MLIIMKTGSSLEETEYIRKKIEDLGMIPHVIPGGIRTAIGVTGNKGSVSPQIFIGLKGVVKCIKITKPYKLISREVKNDDTVIEVNGEYIGKNKTTIIAGPCSVESEKRIMEIAEIVAQTGIKFFRGGAFKPRTSPYSFQGMGLEGLKLLKKAGEEFDLRIITEVLDAETCKMAADYIDVFQIGARNMYNYSLLKVAGQLGKPVLLKRGLSATLEELLLAAEYIVSSGNFNVILCERGIRTYNDYSRNTLDINVIPVIRQLSHLPVIVDPSHSCGDRRYVIPLARAAVAAGANGLLVEVHQDPENAYSDGAQSIFPMQLKQLIKDVDLMSGLSMNGSH